jgi:glycosyltransferase involved in cell wall biosynthesis
MKSLALIVPIKNEEENLADLQAAILKLSKSLYTQSVKLEVIINDNASTDNTAKIIDNWTFKNIKLKYTRFENDIGFQNSIITGFKLADSDAVVVLQGDLQDPPELILEFVDYWNKGALVVGGLIQGRQEGPLQNISRRFFYFLLSSSTDRKILRNFQDFYLLDRVVYKKISASSPPYSFIRARISTDFGVDIAIPYARRKRTKGKSKFSFTAKYDLALDALLLYGKKFGRLCSLSALTSGLIFFSISGFLLACELLGVEFQLKGWFSLILSILFGFSVILFFQGIIIEYLQRIYQTSSKIQYNFADSDDKENY